MKTLLCLALAVFFSTTISAFADTNRTTCGELLNIANRTLKQIEDRFNVGEVTRTDVNKAKLNVLQLRFDCREILIGDYCTQAPAIAEELARGVREEANAGQATTLDVITSEKEAILIRGVCR